MEFEWKCDDCQAVFNRVIKLREHRWEQHLGREVYTDLNLF